MTTRSILAAAALLALSPIALAQQTPSFRGRADIVSVFATVTDKSGGLVPNLTKDDFAVFDEGRRRPITLFSADVQPISIVLLLDRSGSVADESDWVRDAAEQFVNLLHPQDRARIGNFSFEIRLSPSSFTSDHAELKRALREDLQPPGPSPVWTAVDRSITALMNEPGRRVVLLFSDGVDAPASNQVKIDVQDVMYRAQYDEIMVYTIGIPTEEISVQHTYRADGRGRLRASPTITSKRGKPDPRLQKLAAESGGGYFELAPMTTLSSIFTRIADELHRQYWIGINAATLDRKVHKLDVKVLKPGLAVRARKSYVADPQK